MPEESTSHAPEGSACEPLVRPLQDEVEFTAAMEVRMAVFVVEQGFPPHEEFDRRDAESTHFGVWANGEIVGTARLFERRPGMGKLGRVALRREYRGRGWGRLLVARVLQEADLVGMLEVEADAQADLVPFYESLGFVAEGELFEEGGIVHRRIRRVAPFELSGERERSE